MLLSLADNLIFVSQAEKAETLPKFWAPSYSYNEEKSSLKAFAVLLLYFLLWRLS